MRNIKLKYLLFIFLCGGFAVKTMAGNCDGILMDTNLRLDDPIYDFIDRLSSQALLRKYVYGHRPFSVREILSLLDEAELNAPERREEIQYYRSKLLEENCTGEKEFALQAFKRNSVNFDATTGNRKLLSMNGIGRMDARYDSFQHYEEGRKNFEGESLRLETDLAAQFTRYLHFYSSAYAMLLWPRQSAYDSSVGVDRLYLKLRLWNLEFQLGRDSVAWGQGENGGLLFSTHARALDHFAFGNAEAFYFPWIFKHLGAQSYRLVVANLGPDRENSYSWIIAWRGTMAPSRYFEFSFSQAHLFGGEGRPGLAWHEIIQESFGSVNTPSGSGENKGSKIWGVDFRLRTPFLLSSEWYFESVFEDRRSRMFSSLQNFMDFARDQTNFKTGVLLTELGRLKLRLEYTRLNPLIYSHWDWHDGFTLRQQTLGDSLGRDAREFSIQPDWQWNRKWRTENQLSFRILAADLYTQRKERDDGIVRIVKTDNRPDENEWLIQTKTFFQIDSNREAYLSLGYAWVDSYRHQESADRHLYHIGLGLNWLRY